MSSSTVSTLPGQHFAGVKDEHVLLDAEGQQRGWITVAILVGVILLSFFDSLWRTGNMWVNPQYQFGFIVPIIAVMLIWYRRQPFEQVPTWERWLGAFCVALGMLIRVTGSLFTVYYLDNVALIPCLLGVFILVGGLRTMRWAGPAILFLVLMYPFPRAIEKQVMFPLQKLATKASTIGLVTLGVDAIHDGETQIILASRPNPMNVAEQCSGLRMLTIFTAMSVAFALFATDRPLWERIIIVLSAFPIAIIVNVVRITLTGLFLSLLDWWGWSSEMFEKLSHDFAGVFMMPLALGLLYLVFQILKHLVIDTTEDVQSVMISR